MTVARLRDEMPQKEYMAWFAWHARRAQNEEVAMAKLKKGG